MSAPFSLLSERRARNMLEAQRHCPLRFRRSS